MNEHIAARRRFSGVQTSILILLLAATVFSWIYMGHMSGDDMGGMVMDLAGNDPGMEAAMQERALAGLTTVELPNLGMFFPMWTVMCMAMMLPTAIPMILCMARISEQRAQEGQGTRRAVYYRPFLFALGYCVLWSAFGIAVWGIAAGLFALIGPWLKAGWHNLWIAISLLFVATGAYQVSPLKYACMYGCQHPLLFLMKHWKQNAFGAVRMGARHAFDCIGCCVALMIVMLPLGMMNLVWMAIFTCIMFFEKDARIGVALSKVVGWLFLLAGAISLLAALVIRFL